MAVAYKCGIVRIGAITLSTLFPIMLWALRRRPYRSRNTDNFLNLAVAFCLHYSAYHSGFNKHTGKIFRDCHEAHKLSLERSEPYS
jgi:hypothetical protein